MDNESLEFKEFYWIMSLMQAIDVGVIVLDRDYSIQVWNSFMENHSGIRPEKVRGKCIFDFFSEIPEEWFKHKVESVLMLQNRAFSTWEQRPYIFRFKNYRPITGMAEFMYQNITMVPLTSIDGSIRYICIIIYDVTDIALGKKELKLANAQLEHQSRVDPLTLLNNRGYWEECMIREYKRYRRYHGRCSLVIFDIDFFKKVNDTYGHQVGDEVLRVVSQIVVKNTRETDIAGRYGGEEFTVILPDNDAQGALVFAERFRKNVEATTITADDRKINVTISLGITEFSNDVQSYTELIEQADRALYASKEAGRNRTTLFTDST